MARKIAINGFGRIGRCIVRAWSERKVGDLDIVAVSESQKRIGECTYTSSTGTLKGKTTMYDENVTAYDRITGRAAWQSESVESQSRPDDRW